MRDSNLPKVDRSCFKISGLTEKSDETEYWQSKTGRERLEAVEIMRRIIYGDNQCTARLQRVLEIAQLDINETAAGRYSDKADLEKLP